MTGDHGDPGEQAMENWQEICPNMTEEQHELLVRIQQKSLNLLKVFDAFCRENGLLYYLCGGCCIGAVRHRGFVPWDDDVDVMMPRPDYERLARLWPEKMDQGKYRYNRSSRQEFIRAMIDSVSDEETTFIKYRQADLDISHGIRLEIIPLDGCPDSKLKRKEQIFWALSRQLYIDRMPALSKGKLVKGASRAMLAAHPTWASCWRAAERAERHMTKYPFSSSARVTELCTRYKYMLNEYPREIFDSAVYLPFEDMEAPVPVGYDAYLRMVFGDYMRLPPPEDRVPKHETVFADPARSYREYKGKYYPIRVKLDTLEY